MVCEPYIHLKRNINGKEIADTGKPYRLSAEIHVKKMYPEGSFAGVRIVLLGYKMFMGVVPLLSGREFFNL